MLRALPNRRISADCGRRIVCVYSPYTVCRRTSHSVLAHEPYADVWAHVCCSMSHFLCNESLCSRYASEIASSWVHCINAVNEHSVDKSGEPEKGLGPVGWFHRLPAVPWPHCLHTSTIFSKETGSSPPQSVSQTRLTSGRHQYCTIAKLTRNDHLF